MDSYLAVSLNDVCKIGNIKGEFRMIPFPMLMEFLWSHSWLALDEDLNFDQGLPRNRASHIEDQIEDQNSWTNCNFEMFVELKKVKYNTPRLSNQAARE